jgi:hypothetical protein
MRNKSRPLSRKDQLVVQEHDGEVLIYDLRNNKAFCLNTTAALVWQACDGKRDVSAISDHIAGALNQSDSQALVWLALDRLNKENLIEGETEFSNQYKGLTRREIIRKLGIGSMAALPVIASLVAPSPAHAASSCMAAPNGCLCQGGFTTGAFCTGMTFFACAANCKCQSTGSMTFLDNCVP